MAADLATIELENKLHAVKQREEKDPEVYTQLTRTRTCAFDNTGSCRHPAHPGLLCGCLDFCEAQAPKMCTPARFRGVSIAYALIARANMKG